MVPRAASPVTFADLALDAGVLRVLTELGYEEPTPVQQAAIPLLLAGRDVLALAATGTGKTAAFALPLLQRLTPGADARHRLAALVLVPTRELAMQVSEAIHRYGKSFDVHTLAIYGGTPMEGQIRALRRGVDVVVATPGRALDHIRRGTLDLDSVKMVVLDEADEMLDMGFAEDLEAILSEVPEERQTALFSATLAPRIKALAASRMRDPATVQVERAAPAPGASAAVRQVAYIVPKGQQAAAFARVLDHEHPASAIVFCRTRTDVDNFVSALDARGQRAAALHGGLSQDQRDRVMKKFRGKQVDLLVATDVAARGLDISHVSHVINVGVPAAAEAYVHRIGRTGRAGRTGVAITLAEPREHRLLRNIERLTKQRIEVAQLPTVADLHAKRLEIVRATLRELLVAGDLDSWRPVVAPLAEEFDVLDIAAAAVKMASPERDGDGDDLASSVPPAEESPRKPRFQSLRESSGPRASGARSGGKPERGARAKEAWRPRELGGMVRLYIGAGRATQVRPADLVGAIANEAGIPSKSIGSIEIADQFSIVEVPADDASAVIAALKGATIRGRRVLVRRDRG
jgi:ATP-dependent RNA helicase DeaD